jgi:hypothetical protein
MSYTPRATLDQHAVSETDTSPVHQPFPCRNQYQRQHCSFPHAQGLRFFRQQAGIDYRIFGQRALCAADPGRQRVNIVPWLPLTRARTNSFNRARQVQPEHCWQWLPGMGSLACTDFSV